MPLEAIIAGYFNHTRDPQRRSYWNGRVLEASEPLRSSALRHGIPLVILTNCMEGMRDGCTEIVSVKADTRYSPNAFRWFAALEWITDNAPKSAFLVDVSDVEVLNNPFPNLKPGTIYTGYEDKRMDDPWMWRTQGRHLPIASEWKDEVCVKNGGRRLLNCGVVGGRTECLVPFLESLTDCHRRHSRGLKTSSDMSLFHYTIIKGGFMQSVVADSRVVTRFKKYEKEGDAWFRHK